MHRLALLLLGACGASATWQSAVCNHKLRCHLVDGTVEGAAARGKFIDDVHTDGWGKLYLQGHEVKQDGQATRRPAAFASGFLEGALTAELIQNHYLSWYPTQFPSTAPMAPATRAFMMDNFAWTKELVAKHADSGDEYYARIEEVLLRVEGIAQGIDYANKNGLTSQHVNITLEELITLQNAGDLYDIIPATDRSQFKLDPHALDSMAFSEEYHKATSCSSIIKVADDLSDAYAGHTTWTAYENMLRVFKHWEMRALDNSILSKVSFSSKPGSVYSKDDFYALDMEGQQMVVMETTNGVMDKSLYDYVTPKSLMSWVRLPVCNDIARSGAQWTRLMARHNSGTYANQWIILDMKKFTPGAMPAAGFLNLIETAPTIAVSGDVTEVFINNGFHWPSMNVPFFPEVYEKTGFKAAFEQHGNDYSWENCPRHLIYKRDHHKGGSLDGIARLLRYNQFQTDPYSHDDPTKVISSRADLPSSSGRTPKPSGGVDTKVTSYSRIMNNNEAVAIAQNGPTHDDQEPFRWSTSAFKDHPHYGQPDLFNFGFVEMSSNFDYEF